MRIESNVPLTSLCQYIKTSINNNDGFSSDDEMQKLVDSIKDKTGLVHKHLLPLQRLADKQNCIISIRPVDRLATELIESGYPTKGYHIKGKTASWGPQAGFICEEQRFSKLEDSTVECIDKFNHQVRQCIKEGYAASVELKISKKRLNTLLEKGIIDDLSFENASGIRSFRSQAPSGKCYFFEARRLSGSDEETYLILHDNKPISILAPTENALAFTADYDLFIIAPHISDFGSQDNLSVPDIAHEVFRHRVDSYHKELPINHELIQDYSDPASFYKKEDPDIGNASKRVRQMIDLINTSLVGNGEKVVHHSMDCASPVTDIATNYPATFAMPKKTGRFDKLCVIENSDELKELIFEAKNAGYHIKTNPLWGEGFSKIHPHNFDDSRNLLMRKFKLTP